jgi:hypothetical protein
MPLFAAESTSPAPLTRMIGLHGLEAWVLLVSDCGTKRSRRDNEQPPDA